MSLPSILSFESLDQAHYIATGEHLPHREGNEAPLPLEFHIKATQQRQQRKRLWEILDEILNHDMTEVKPGIVNGVSFHRAMRHEDQIFIFSKDNHPVMVLTADGIEPTDSTPCSPVPFKLQRCFEIGEEALLEEHAAAKEELAHASEHLSSVQAALRLRHISRH